MVGKMAVKKVVHSVVHSAVRLVGQKDDYLVGKLAEMKDQKKVDSLVALMVEEWVG